MERDYKDSIRVCMVISNFYPVIGGAEKQAQRLSKNLIEDGAGVFVLTRKQRGCPGYEIIDGIPVYRLFSFQGYNKLSSFLFNIHLLYSLIRFRNEYDIIHSHLLSTSTVISIAVSKLFRKKTIVKLGCAGRTGDISYLKNSAFMGKWKLGFIVKNIDLFIAISQEIKHELQYLNIRDSRIEIVPNGIDTRRYSKPGERRKRGLREKILPQRNDSDKNIILFIGRFSHQKNISILLRAFKRLLMKSDNFLLILIGDGPLKDRYIEWVRDNNISACVMFTGIVEDVKTYLQMSDVFVLSSFHEGMPNALLEAMSCGVLPVCSRIGGIEDIIEDGKNGFLFSPDNENELLERLEQLFFSLTADRKQEMSKRARDTIEAAYDIKGIAKRYSGIYRRLVY